MTRLPHAIRYQPGFCTFRVFLLVGFAVLVGLPLLQLVGAI